jgi:hypothetical protein
VSISFGYTAFLSFPSLKLKFFLYFCKNDTFMARRKKIEEDEEGREWSEAELVLQFNLKRIVEYETTLMKEWLAVEEPTLSPKEKEIFDEKYALIVQNHLTWSEEDLKMKFITHILDLGHLKDENGVVGYFDKLIWAKVEGMMLKVKSDFMLAKGYLNLHQNPYFHFQEYKPNLKPTGEPIAQLIEAFLIGQAKNEKPIPLYGVQIVGKEWTFIIMEGKEYCISKSFAATEKDDLLKIIAILRKFKHILFTRLML